jgi:predicted Fe-Mo cluster-binding NifX family protein
MNVRLQYPAEFSAGVWADTQMKINNYTIRVDLITQTADEESSAIAFERLKYFLYEALDSAVLINAVEQSQIKLLSAAGIKVVAMPETPVDQIVGMMLFAKLNAVMENRVAVTEIAISSDLSDHVTYLHNDHETLAMFESSGWWNSAGPETQELVEPKKKTVWNLKNHSAWSMLNLDWPAEESLTSQDSGNTIVFADFDRTNK